MPRRLAEGGLAARACLALLGVALLAGGCTSAPGTDGTGPQVTVFGPWRGEAADLFRASLAPFEDRTGIDIVYTGSGDFPSELVDRIQGGDPPDIAMFPQPGLLNRLAADGYVLPLPRGIADTASASYRPALRTVIGESATVNGVIFRVNVKSLVWYRPAVFQTLGYQVPGSWEELTALSEAVVDDGLTPWCMGVEAFGFSGWPATDWIEDIVLRTGGPSLYDRWVAGQVPFTDPAIAVGYQQFSDLLLAPDEVLGGRRGVLNTSVERAQDPMFADPPGCLMYRQASFQVENLPEGTRIGPDGDVDVFVLPATGGGPAPLLVGGDVAGAMTDRDETWRVMEQLASAQSAKAWIDAGGFISPHAAAADYPTAFDAAMSDVLDRAAVARFDGSDLMDPRVGSDTFLKSAVHYIGTLRLTEALELAQSGYQAQSTALP